MSPRPLEHEPSPFERPLDLAREGRHADAVSGMLGVLDKSALHDQHRAAAAMALGHIARMAETAGDLESAESALDQAIRIAPTYADLRFQLACLLIRMQQRPAARRELDAALSINPRYVAARVERALLDAQEGLLGEALATFRALGEEHRIGEPRAFQQGLKSLERADWEEAGALLKQALKLGDFRVEDAIHNFHAVMAQGHPERAIQLLRDAVARHEGYTDLHLLLGQAELEEGHVDDAVASLARALELHPDYHAARVQFARALEVLGDLTQALEQVALVLQVDPEHPQALQLHERWTRRRTRRRRTSFETRKAS
ncbi:MAG TPA: tetratricopeptide repeat protein [Candidatus Limnocylindria bacterium]|nr:tetratricopeptide repeat protein [Candidatus Limnocylindria bacterium]